MSPVNQTLISSLDRQITMKMEHGVHQLVHYPLSLIRGIVPLPWKIKPIWFMQHTMSVIKKITHFMLLAINYPIILLALNFSIFNKKCAEHQHIVSKEFGDDYTLFNFNFLFIIDVYYCLSKTNDEILCFDSLSSLLSLNEV